jgi:Ca2+-binding RTX toxin-like protein
MSEADTVTRFTIEADQHITLDDANYIIDAQGHSIIVHFENYDQAITGNLTANTVTIDNINLQPYSLIGPSGQTIVFENLPNHLRIETTDEDDYIITDKQLWVDLRGGDDTVKQIATNQWAYLVDPYNNASEPLFSADGSSFSYEYNLTTNSVSTEGNFAFVGGNLNDKIISGGNDDRLYGNEGDDYINAGEGDDEINGDAGNDTLIGGPGSDKLRGGAGDDFYVYDGIGSDKIEDQSGIDTLMLVTSDVAIISDSGGYRSNNDFVLSSVDGQNEVIFKDAFLDGGLEYFNYVNTTFGVDVTRQLHSADYVPSEGSHYLVGTNLNDVVSVSGNADIAATGYEGNDTLTGGALSDYLFGGSGNDTLSGVGGNDTMLGGDGEDRLLGGDGDDTLIGGNGRDRLFGGDGNDTLDGSAGDADTQGPGDYIRAGLGQDTIIGHQEYFNQGGEGAVISYGDISGIGGVEITVTDDGTGAGTVTSRSGSSIDDQFTYVRAFQGSTDDDIIRGGTGHEVFAGLKGSDTLYGGSGGSDLLQYNDDRYETGGGGAVTVNFELGTAIDGFGDTDTFFDMEEVRGSELGDTFIGSANDERMLGVGGNDTMLGGDGEDRLIGGDGDDVLYGDGSLTTYTFNAILTEQDQNWTAVDLERVDLALGLYHDSPFTFSFGDKITFFGGEVVRMIIDQGTLYDTINFEGYNNSFEAYDPVISEYSNVSDERYILIEQPFKLNDTNHTLTFEIYSEGDHFDQIQTLEDWFDNSQRKSQGLPEIGAYQPGAEIDYNDVVASSLATKSRVSLGSGDDYLDGGAGDDYLEDGYGSDEVYGGAGDDTINNIGGSDLFDGGDGSDTLITDISTGFDERSFEIGFDTVAGTHGRLNSDLGQDTIASIENFTLKGNFNAVVTGGDEDNIFITDAGDDVIRGGAGDDTLSAWIGNDEVYAGAGNDTIINTGGEDHFDGGEGVDTLITDLSQSVKDRLGLSLDFDIVFDLTAEDPHMRHYAVKPDGTDYAWDEIYSIENYTLIGDFDVKLTGDDQANILVSDMGDDVIRGGAGTDLVEGGAGDDTIVLDGNGTYGSGFAALNISSSLQTGTEERINLNSKTRFEDVMDGGADVDTVELTDASDAFFLHDSFSGFHSSLTLSNDHEGRSGTARIENIENIYAGGGDDIIDLTSPDYSLAGQGITVDGGEGNDTLWGSDANETLKGGNGDDELFGGVGVNELIGGSGADEFQFTKTSANDTIADFSISDGDTLKFFNTGGAQFDRDSIALNSAGDELTIAYGSSADDLLTITLTNAGLQLNDLATDVLIIS